MNLSRNRKGFTLIELLVVIAIIATLAVVVFVALNPVRRFKEARNATRATEVNEILTAAHEYILDNNGALPASIDIDAAVPPIVAGNVYMVGTGGVGCLPVGYACSDAGVTVQADCVDLGTDMTTAGYLASMPIDPTGGTVYDATFTGYTVRVDAGGLITMQSCGVEDPDGTGAPVIKVSR